LSNKLRYTITERECFVRGGHSDDPHIIPLDEQSFDRLEDFGSTEKFSVIYKFKLSDGRDALRSRHYTGAIVLKDGTMIEILPQFSRDSDENAVFSKATILQMLREMNETPVKHVDELYFKKEQLNLFEIFVRMFAEEVTDIVRNGLKMAYVPYRGNEMFVKGKTIYHIHAKKNFAHKERFFVEYDVFSVNRAENRLIKSTLLLLDKLSTNRLNRKMLHALIPEFDDVEKSLNYKTDFDANVLDRSMNRYNNAIKWARLFLLNRESSTFFNGGKVAYALLLPLDKIFSSYIAAGLRHSINRNRYYFMTPDSISNSIRKSGKDAYNVPLPNFYIKNRFTGEITNIRFRFTSAADINTKYDGDAKVIFPITKTLNTSADTMPDNRFLLNMNEDVDEGISILKNSLFG